MRILSRFSAYAFINVLLFLVAGKILQANFGTLCIINFFVTVPQVYSYTLQHFYYLLFCDVLFFLQLNLRRNHPIFIYFRSLLDI